MAEKVHVKTKQGKIEAGGLNLDVVCSQFEGRVFLFISDLQKMGTLMEVRQDAALSTSAKTYSVRTLLGIDTPEVHVFGRAIAAHILPSSFHLLLALGLSQPSPHILPQLLPLLEQYKVWEH